MNEMTIKPRVRPPAEDGAPEAPVAASKPSTKPAKKVIKLGAKERLNSYVTPEQKRKLRLLAIARNCSISEIVGVLTDEAADPVL